MEITDCKQEIRRAALYVRVSSEEQARNGESVGDQLQALRAWARENRYIAPLEYLDEGFSARKSYKTRPAMRRLLDDIQAGKVSIIAFVKLDRWFRSVKDYYAVQTILDAHGVEWIAIAEEYTTTTTQGRLLLNLRLSIAEMEADTTGDRIKFTFDQKRARGEVVTGSVPLGYRIENKKPVKDETTAPIMEAFWNAYTSTGSLSAAQNAAENAGLFIPPPRACRILKNAVQYAGHVQGIDCPAYITDDQAAAIMATRKTRARRTAYTHLFNGFIYCGICGGRMAAHWSMGKNKTVGKYRYTTYYCYNSINRKCTNRINLNQNKIENMLLCDLETAFDAYIIQAKMEQANNPPAPDPAEKIKALADRRARLVELYLDAAIDKADFEKRRKEIDDDIARLSAAPAPEPVRDPERLRALLPDNWRAIYADLTTENRRAFWFQLLERIDVYPDRSIRFYFK